VVGSVMPLRDQDADGEVLVPAAQDTGSRTASIRSTCPSELRPSLTSSHLVIDVRLEVLELNLQVEARHRAGQAAPAAPASRRWADSGPTPVMSVLGLRSSGDTLL
jgi:hypothetical protein